MEEKELSLAIIGDIYVQRDDPISAFSFTGEVLRKADIAFGNQEVALSNKGAPIIPGRLCIRSDPRMVDALLSAGIDIVGLANNHSMDFGPEAIMQTIEILDKAGIAHVGAGINDEEAHRPVILDRNGTKFAFLSYSSVFIPEFFPAQKNRPGIAVVRMNTAYQPHRRVFEQPGSPALAIVEPEERDFLRMQQNIYDAKKLADFLTVSWHWGISEGYGKVVEYQREMGKAAIDAGADIVVGHHPHMLQGIEIYKGKAIFYSLGNFVFDFPLEHSGRETIIIICRIINKKIYRINLVPAWINDQGETILLDIENGKSVIEHMKRLSSAYGTSIQIRGTEFSVDL